MKILKSTRQIVFLLGSILLFSFTSVAQGTGSLSVTKEADGNYHVYFKPNINGSFTVLEDAAITIKSTAGSFLPGTVTTVNSPGNGWVLGNTKYTTGGQDYISFVPGSAASAGSSFMTGTKIKLFSFTSSGTCSSGSVEIYNGAEILSPSSVSYVTTLVVQDTPTSLAREGFDGVVFDTGTASCATVVITCLAGNTAPVPR